MGWGASSRQVREARGSRLGGEQEEGRTETPGDPGGGSIYPAWPRGQPITAVGGGCWGESGNSSSTHRTQAPSPRLCRSILQGSCLCAHPAGEGCEAGALAARGAWGWLLSPAGLPAHEGRAVFSTSSPRLDPQLRGAQGWARMGPQWPLHSRPPSPRSWHMER